ncbi:HAD family hydrolase [Dictyobacter alpinus]|uniref:HAD family hydrolase n=1 Tax=Dictyobacter alpinus TaxID=2014873 RepID=UPI0013867ADE|nr:HAD family hydrolase [Dictyobacter alpinus]
MSDLAQESNSLPFGTSAILFDLDDTLHHRSKAFDGWAREVAARYYTAEQTEKLEAMIAYLVELDMHGYRPRDDYFRQAKQRYPEIQGSIEQLIIEYQRDVIEHIVLEDDIQLLLQRLQERQIPFGIVTNGEGAQQQRKIIRLGIDKYTSCIFISKAFGAQKPAASIFLAAANCLQKPTQDILFVGDNPEFDIWGAHQVGMKTVWIQHEQRYWPEHISQDVADLTIHSFAELLPGLGLHVDTVKREQLS